MNDDDTPEVDAAVEWADSAPTEIAGVDPKLLAEAAAAPEPIEDKPTGRRDVTELPGYHLGKEAGIIAGARMVLDEMRDVLIEGGTDPGVAHVVTEKLRRRLGLNEI